MKKTIFIISLLAHFIGKTQCPAPSNVTILSNMITEVVLDWTENGTANSWEITVIPYYDIGTPIPTIGIIYASGSPFGLTGIQPTCNGYFVRSVCSATEVSAWSAVASSQCSHDVYVYLATLSTDNTPTMPAANQYVISPNPAKEVIQIKENVVVEKITVFDSMGKMVAEQSGNQHELTISGLASGLYLMELKVDGKTSITKFIKE
ncbi:MAG: hypothetical protein CFE24_14460 [Flavobacterium sp. BFFFF2]|nr:MAG: hypothetical protein CFE24_14460 [Flavobacterium sp. BFFFF2]